MPSKPKQPELVRLSGRITLVAILSLTLHSPTALARDPCSTYAIEKWVADKADTAWKFVWGGKDLDKVFEGTLTAETPEGTIEFRVPPSKELSVTLEIVADGQLAEFVVRKKAPGDDNWPDAPVFERTGIPEAPVVWSGVTGDPRQGADYQITLVAAEGEPTYRVHVRTIDRGDMGLPAKDAQGFVLPVAQSVDGHLYGSDESDWYLLEEIPAGSTVHVQLLSVEGSAEGGVHAEFGRISCSEDGVIEMRRIGEGFAITGGSSGYKSFSVRRTAPHYLELQRYDEVDYAYTVFVDADIPEPTEAPE